MKKVSQSFGLFDRPKSGRKRIMTDRDGRKLARESKKSLFKTANQLRLDCNLQFYTSVAMDEFQQGSLVLMLGKRR